MFVHRVPYHSQLRAQQFELNGQDLSQQLQDFQQQLQDLQQQLQNLQQQLRLQREEFNNEITAMKEFLQMLYYAPYGPGSLEAQDDFYSQVTRQQSK